MSPTQFLPPKRGFLRWSTRDLLITIAIALVFSLALVPITYAYAMAQGLGILARAAVGGLYFLPAAFAAYVMRKPGSILLVSGASGLAIIPFTPFGFVALMIGLITGGLGELTMWLITRYRHFGLTRLVLAAATAGLLEYLLILTILQAFQLAWWLAVLAMGLSGLTFAASAALAKFLADTIVKTGVLANTELGRSIAEDV